ncbi:MAG: lysylphosphatidylglycerol synthase transmembrane domain-containing protein [Bacteroidota bacterium]
MKSITNILKYLLFFIIGFGLLWYTFRNQSLEDIYYKISHAHLGWVMLSLVISSMALISRSMRWNLLIEPLGYKPKLLSSFYSLMVGYFANLAIPRIGEISRCGALSKAEDIPFNKLIGTVIIERFSDLLMLIVSIIILAMTEYELLGGFLSDKIINPILNGVQNSAVLLIVIAVVFVVTGIIIWKWLQSPSSGNLKLRIRNILNDVLEGLKSVFRMKNGYAFIGHTLFIWLMYFLMMYVSFFAMEPTSGLGIKAGLFVMVVGGIAMSAPVQGGIGTYHLLVSQGLMVYHVSAEDGIAFATLVHTWQLILLIVLGTWSLIALFRKKKLLPAT